MHHIFTISFEGGQYPEQFTAKSIFVENGFKAHIKALAQQAGSGLLRIAEAANCLA